MKNKIWRQSVLDELLVMITEKNFLFVFLMISLSIIANGSGFTWPKLDCVYISWQNFSV